MQLLLTPQNLIALYAITIGTMIIMWHIFFFMNLIPQPKEKPIETGAHILAEIITGIMAISAGVTILLRIPGLELLLPIALGMILYATIQATGHYAEIQGISPMTVILVIVVGLTIVLILGLLLP